MTAMVFSSWWWSSFSGLKVLLTLWSSANPFKIRSFTISSNAWRHRRWKEMHTECYLVVLNILVVWAQIYFCQWWHWISSVLGNYCTIFFCFIWWLQISSLVLPVGDHGLLCWMQLIGLVSWQLLLVVFPLPIAGCPLVLWDLSHNYDFFCMQIGMQAVACSHHSAW